MTRDSKSIAVMQPYIFPYIGYFQLIKAVDEFVFYDDVNFIKRGWINRNRILINGTDKLISIPCLQASQNKLINEVNVDFENKHYNKVILLIYHSYKKAPYFDSVYPILSKTFDIRSSTIAELAINSVKNILNYLEIEKKTIVSSKEFAFNRGLEKSERLIDITKKLEGNKYVNAFGGMDLYEKKDFKKFGIELQFLKSNIKSYKQFTNNFVPGLSIIDILMFNNKQSCIEMLSDFELL
ncbi:WbqC family protein [Psychroflexus sp. YR1-1]|uniref:WbqC family protein n=1 Tax=Psychroflexus aurantiacus TaxID=2709310 RepID=A0A6B3R8I6_9FLAO|nr:WbqC family protein [Psychroflexus aurantiacus]NEV93951.1 WbqC family protein [Psychroflexus aurantiacus]